MSRLSVPNLETTAGPSGQIYAQIKKAIGSVPNTFAALAAHGPAALKSVLAADAVLAAGTLSKPDQEVIKLVISEAAGCDYCVAAHNHLAKLAGVKPEPLKQLLGGQHTGDAKRDALIGFVRKLAQSRGTVSDEDFVAIKAAGYSDAQLVEISLAFATTVFTNVFNRINDTEIDFPAVA
ncbi:alkylhydroperoxidase [Bradyrhizobium nanningense]|uniref:Alkylhydroperoxidase n=1 Tax=Bradyrhizobium nanningense TaxID=1325118 RepID=A0A4Q0S0S0_9BRAD|nr:carboxymuconolactone decarboxylase family protein [Bradyrhizobium nanningense]RXH26307.1 alkylhydroperoxidase [Bradyrhizobium nanningense]RXH29541.1 alkylhydroperoxidase [Bradyrhizobium nanningense]